jgi:hypothetical protein
MAAKNTPSNDASRSDSARYIVSPEGSEVIMSVNLGPFSGGSTEK